MAVDGKQRGGILGLGAILTITSLPLRTSPIKRGNWVLSQVLGTPPPPPPPVVPQFSHDEHDDQGLSIIQQMRLHRSDPRCISCHAQIDPLGVALERFDPIRAVCAGRTRDGGSQIADLETTASGETLQGVESLKRYLLADAQRRKLMRNLCVKFLGYALGRKLVPMDDATIDGLMSELERQGWRSSVLIIGALDSPEFLQRHDPDHAGAASPAEASP